MGSAMISPSFINTNWQINLGKHHEVVPGSCARKVWKEEHLVPMPEARKQAPRLYMDPEKATRSLGNTDGPGPGSSSSS